MHDDIFKTFKTSSRLRCDVQEVLQLKDPQINIALFQNDLTHIAAILIPSSGNPYCYGMFGFNLSFKEMYPDEPPAVRFQTTNMGLTRFNPNLYSDGKVCLSILGTFSGPSWTSALSLNSLLLSILSLFSENPYTNEPGYEVLNSQQHRQSDLYNAKIMHESIRISVIQRINNLLELSTCEKEPFFYLILTTFLQRMDGYVKLCDDMQHFDGQTFKIAQFEYEGNQMAGVFKFLDLKTRITALYETISSIICSNSITNLSSSGQSCDPSLNFVLSFQEIKPLHFNASISGPEFTPYEYQSINIDIQLHSDQELYPPLVCITSPVLHPCISPITGIPYINETFVFVDKLLLMIYDLLRNYDRGHHPFEILNEEAARDLLANKKQFNRRARRMLEEANT